MHQIAKDARQKTSSWTYDDLGKMLTKSYPDGVQVEEYTYDALGRLETHERPSGKKATYSCDLRDRPLTITWSGTGLYGSGENVTFTWKDDGRPESATNGVATITNGYLTNGDLDYSTQSHSGGSWKVSYAQETGQVVGVDHNVSNPETKTTALTRDHDYTYDDMGNRTNFSVTADGASGTVPQGSSSYTPNDYNQYSAVSSPTSPPNGARNHDADGNLTSDGTRSYVWDAWNRLREVKNSSGTVIATYTYDAQGRRVSKETTTAAVSADTGAALDEETVLFIYDGWNVIQEWAMADGETSFSLRAYLVWGEDLSGSLQGAGGVGGLLARISTSGSIYYHYDANGNPARLTSTDSSTGTYRYDAFGNIREAAGDLVADNPWKFSTKYRDEETGFSYYGYRYYDPATGRWPSRDPIGERGGLNLYGFVGNDGVNEWDLLGQMGPVSPFTCNNHPSNSVPDTTRVKASDLGLSIFSDEDKKKVKKKAESLGVCDMEVGERVESGDIKVLAIATDKRYTIGHLSAVISGEYTRLNGGWSFDGEMDPEDEQVFDFGPKKHHPRYLNECLGVLQWLNPIVKHTFVIDGTIPWVEAGPCCSEDEESEG